MQLSLALRARRVVGRCLAGWLAAGCLPDGLYAAQAARVAEMAEMAPAARAVRAGEAQAAAPAVQAQVDAPPAGTAGGARAPSKLPDQATIRAAIRTVLDEQPAIPRLHEADTLRSNQYDRFARQMDDATVPDCLHADGLKRQPTFFLGGLLALPFVAVAKVRGKCQ